MAFKEVQDLTCDVTTALGGFNKKTNKANPTKIEGYYLGTKEVESRKSKGGKAKLHTLQTAEGNIGVWGKTDLDRKMTAVPVGAMIRVTQSGTVPTPNGDMYKFKVEVDKDNSLDVETIPYQTESSDSSSFSEASEEESSFDSEDSIDEVHPAPAKAPAAPAAVANASKQASLKELLAGNRKR